MQKKKTYGRISNRHNNRDLNCLKLITDVRCSINGEIILQTEYSLFANIEYMKFAPVTVEVQLLLESAQQNVRITTEKHSTPRISVGIMLMSLELCVFCILTRRQYYRIKWNKLIYRFGSQNQCMANRLSTLCYVTIFT